MTQMKTMQKVPQTIDNFSN